jgi:hypothetical protein
MLSEKQVKIQIQDLLSLNSTRKTKYQRNFQDYNQLPFLPNLESTDPACVGYWEAGTEDSGPLPKINVVKSAIDAVYSKMLTSKVRPFINTIKGSFKTIQICKQLQTFYDYFYEEEDVTRKIGEAVRDACIYDTGFIYFDEVSSHVYKLQPWNVYTRPAEKSNLNSVYIEFPNDSIDLIPEEVYKLLSKQEKDRLYVTWGIYYNAKQKTKAYLINKTVRKVVETKFDCCPILPIYYTAPNIGNTALSIADMLRGIQYEIDQLMIRIAEAIQISPANTILLDSASNIKVGKLKNKVGNVLQYDSSSSNPPQVVAPNFISDQYKSFLNELIEKAYNLVGISQLSAQGKKTPGLNSGVAMATQEDIESDRFQNLVDQYISAYTRLAKLMMKMIQGDKDIVEPNRYSLSLKWEDVEKEYAKMRIQFSAADSLSKDPSEKLKQLQALAQAGIIPASQIASLLELPDINRGYSVANNAFNATMTLIDACIYDDKYEVPEYIPAVMLKEQIVNMMMSLRAAEGSSGSNEKDIAKLIKYYGIVEKTTVDDNTLQAQANAQDVNQHNQFSQDVVGQDADKLDTDNEGTANPVKSEITN